MEILFGLLILILFIALIIGLRQLSGSEPIDAQLYFTGELLNHLNVKKKMPNTNTSSGEMWVLSGLFNDVHYEITVPKQKYKRAVSYYLKYTLTTPAKAIKAE